MKKLSDIKILVVGDIMLDKYILGNVKRISPEAPVPIVKVVDEYSTLGGCGNVVRNLTQFGVQVHCAASVTDDPAGNLIYQKLEESGVSSVLIWKSKTTTVKERIIADQRNVQMLRIDREIVYPIDHKDLIEEITIHDSPWDMIVVSDYGKGLITWGLMEFLRILNIPIIIDPIPDNDSLYGRPLMITPNQDEWSLMQRIDASKPEFVLVTEGKDGMTLYDYRQGRGKIKIPAKPVEVYNVSGAGDTVIAVMAVCLSMDIYPDKCARIANDCAAYVVTQVGTSVVPKNILLNSLGSYNIVSEE
jgi:D-beta-D-heptose 7-phosphate kinase/D-beta-D-heptose 1-phosphate adenosyltransferase